MADADDAAPDDGVEIDVTVVLAMPDTQYQKTITVALGTTARAAVERALRDLLIPINAVIDIDPLTAALGIFSEVIDDNYVLSAGERVEIYRPLKQDPKEWRRQRAKQAG